MNTNNPSPLVPQGSLLEQKNKGRARVKIAVFVVLAIHGIGLMALLMQGCKKEPDASTQGAADQVTNAPPPIFESTNQPVADANVPAAPSTTVAAPPVPVPAAGTTEYTIVKGDTYGTISKKFHVTTKAITDANPGVEPTKLKIGQIIHIPAPTQATGSTGSTGATGTESDGGQLYTVKSGDSLSKIATEFSVTVKALRSANNLTTDKIVVGQKLKIPAKTASPPPTTDTAPPAPSAK